MPSTFTAADSIYTHAKPRWTKKTGLAPVTLRSFSSEQLLDFLTLYSRARGHADVKQVLERHLSANPTLHEVVRTPLLATILCEIAFNDPDDLPKSETQLYRDRFRMLSGELDDSKQIKRRIRTRQIELQKACRRIAVCLHIDKKRYASHEEMIEMLVDPVSLGWKRTKARTVVLELEDPCQLLVHMTEDNLLGFGHLRFQEFFAMEEICTWQLEEMSPLLADHWWRDVFVLFAVSADNILQFLNNLQIRFLNQEAKDTVQKMIFVLPDAKRQRLRFKNPSNSIVVKNWIEQAVSV